MTKGIIFFDIDGTILSLRNFKISESTRTAIKKAQINGYLCFVNTGRTMAEIEHEITDIGFDGFICGCGTYISYHGNLLLHESLEPDIVKLLISDLKNYRMDAVLEGTTAIYYEEGVTHPYFVKVRDSQKNIYGFNIRTWNDQEPDFDKFCIIPKSDGDLAGFQAKYKDIFDFIDRENQFFEVIPAGYSKATGIKFLQEYLKIPQDNTYALGDSSNDLTMLSHVKHSIAMGNSSQDILDIASFITKDVDEGGVEHALKHFHII